MLKPMKMTPAFRYGSATPWGGEGLRALGKAIPDAQTGESLEVSVLPGLESRDEAGNTLTALLEAYGEAMRGTQVSETFPLLLKLISAQEMLSVQVHPDDAYANAHEGGKLGKTEAWVILDAEPGAQIVYGIREGVTREQLAKACQCGGEAVQGCLSRVNVKPDEVYYIPAGMVHALGGGITLMEIQQSSDVTYRFYDWDRVDAQGRSRELHLQKGLDVTDVSLHLSACVGETSAYAGGQRTVFIDEPAFALERWHAEGSMPLPQTPNHFTLLCALGDGELAWDGGSMALRRGDCVYLPAQSVQATLRGTLDVLACWPGSNQKPAAGKLTA
ncbi:MAG: type I phosphomannose isomerase catalytic subunit [Candidatus Ventricola sp.]